MEKNLTLLGLHNIIIVKSSNVCGVARLVLEHGKAFVPVGSMSRQAW